MKEKIIIKRYAEAFLSDARKTIGMEKAIEEFKALRNIIRQNPDFKDFLENLEITYTEKCGFIDKVLKEPFSQEIRNFLKLLLVKERIEFLVEIADYIRVNYAHGEAVDALLKTAYPLDLELLEAIKEKLEDKLQKKFNLYLELDSELSGGVQITVGNKVIDGSVKRRLEELRSKLMTVRVV